MRLPTRGKWSRVAIGLVSPAGASHGLRPSKSANPRLMSESGVSHQLKTDLAEIQAMPVRLIRLPIMRRASGRSLRKTAAINNTNRGSVDSRVLAIARRAYLSASSERRSRRK